MVSLAKYFISEFSGTKDMSPERVKNLLLTVPNAITLAGIALVGAYVAQFVLGIFVWLIPINILLIGLSDLLDGYFAEKLDQHSWLGKFLDGFRDRIFNLACLVNFMMFCNGVFDYFLFTALVLIELGNAYVVIRINLDTMQIAEVYNVHLFSKIRQFIHCSCCFAFVIQQYWVSFDVLRIETLLSVMLLASTISLLRNIYATRIYFKRKAIQT